MHSDHRHPGSTVNRATVAGPSCTTLTIVLSGVRVSSGVSMLLRDDHPRSMRAFAQMMRLDGIWGSLQQLRYSVETGKPGMEKLEPKGAWAYLHVVVYGRAESQPRMTAQAGDFFVDALPAADGYLLMDVLHDWPDEQCVSILAAIRRPAPAGAVLLVIEDVIPEGHADARASTLDIVMLAVAAGRERTAGELSELFARAGFRLDTAPDTPSHDGSCRPFPYSVSSRRSGDGVLVAPIAPARQDGSARRGHSGVSNYESDAVEALCQARGSVLRAVRAGQAAPSSVRARRPQVHAIGRRGRRGAFLLVRGLWCARRDSNPQPSDP
jgi:O-methyltransferase